MITFSTRQKAEFTRRLPPYAFRHAFATLILGEGEDLKSSSDIPGHSRPDTTMKVCLRKVLNVHRKTIKKNCLSCRSRRKGLTRLPRGVKCRTKKI